LDIPPMGLVNPLKNKAIHFELCKGTREEEENGLPNPSISLLGNNRESCIFLGCSIVTYSDH
jgi:hypothetical protein